MDPDAHALTGWMVTVAGQSANQGTNNLEYPGFDASLGMAAAAWPDGQRATAVRLRSRIARNSLPSRQFGHSSVFATARPTS